MKYLILMIIFLAGCSTNEQQQSDVVEDQIEEQEIGEHRLPPDSYQEVSLWGTYYYMKEVDKVSSGIPLRNMSDQVIGPQLSSNTWCLAAIEGTVRVDGVTYNYAGVKYPKQTSCSHSASSRVRWKKSPYKFGIGNRNNALVPFKTVACDQGNVSGSKRWLNGGYMKFGQEFFVPAAKGVKLPDGTVHDGWFVCGDTGGAITGHHIDFFIGGIIGGNSGALKVNPFSFIKSSSSKTFKAYIPK